MPRFKEFRAFWPCSFTSPSVKGIDKFWKFRGLIEDFADIWFSGVKTAEEAMAEGVDYCRPEKTSHKGFV